jgi:hypothetical protein
MTAGGKTSVLRLLGGWSDLVLPDQKVVTKVVISIPDDIETGDV